MTVDPAQTNSASILQPTWSRTNCAMARKSSNSARSARNIAPATRPEQRKLSVSERVADNPLNTLPQEYTTCVKSATASTVARRGKPAGQRHSHSAGIAASRDAGSALCAVKSEAPLTDPRLNKLTHSAFLIATDGDADCSSAAVGIALVNGPA
ncbi:Uncharacterised protein [Mycobacteroides abscessus subsp. abscessus]|nr:Uncharacterised protein [Mycobacteroides abscessus subsp. abscessus]SIG00263.1 Uncharacterised protein [Mycobacteroides abscessus subsp. abscessus]SIG50888.1 Uncharacterised protein [Mycobacteroides abscessus subsp. abscessus]SII32769.1 Uncharacterised protein [Mycobacteroides abscessus subsp. abscessus]